MTVRKDPPTRPSGAVILKNDGTPSRIPRGVGQHRVRHVALSEQGSGEIGAG
jgi:hypothetical protein